MLCDYGGLTVLTVKDPSLYPKAAAFPLPSDQVQEGESAGHWFYPWHQQRKQVRDWECAGLQGRSTAQCWSPHTPLCCAVSFVEEALQSWQGCLGSPAPAFPRSWAVLLDKAALGPPSLCLDTTHPLCPGSQGVYRGSLDLLSSEAHEGSRAQALSRHGSSPRAWPTDVPLRILSPSPVTRALGSFGLAVVQQEPAPGAGPALPAAPALGNCASPLGSQTPPGKHRRQAKLWALATLHKPLLAPEAHHVRGYSPVRCLDSGSSTPGCPDGSGLGKLWASPASPRIKLVLLLGTGDGAWSGGPGIPCVSNRTTSLCQQSLRSYSSAMPSGMTSCPSLGCGLKIMKVGVPLNLPARDLARSEG